MVVNVGIKRLGLGISLMVQWLRLCTSTAGGTGSIPSWETKIPHAVRPKKEKKRLGISFLPHSWVSLSQ